MTEEELIQQILDECKWFEAYSYSNFGGGREFYSGATTKDGNYRFVERVSFKSFDLKAPRDRAVAAAIARNIIRDVDRLKSIGIKMTLEDARGSTTRSEA